MSLDRRYRPKKGIMLSTFKSVSQLDTTQCASSVQSPQYKSRGERPGIHIYSAIHDIHTPKKELRKDSMAQQSNYKQRRGSYTLDKTLEISYIKQRSCRRSIESIVYQRQKKKIQPASAKYIKDQINPAIDFVLDPPKTIKPINMTKGELRRLIYGRSNQPYSRTEVKRNKINLYSNKQNMDTSANGFQELNTLKFQTINIQVQTCRGSLNKMMICSDEEPKNVVDQLKSEYGFGTGTSNQLLNLLQKQMSHLNKRNIKN